MIRIAIADDEISFAERERKLTVQFFRSQEISCKPVIYQKPQELLWDIQEGHCFDIYLIDIEMPVVSGMDLAYEIRQRYDNPYIIFVTSHLEYSIQGYEYNAWRFIMKEELEKNLLLAFDSLLKRWKKKPEKFYVLKKQTTVLKIVYSDIYYLHKDGKYTVFYTTQGTFRERNSITKVLESLDTSDFLYTDRAYIVNLRHVIRLESNTIVMRDGSEVPSSVLQLQNVKRAVNEYWNVGL